MGPSDLTRSDAAALRAELGHPIIDTDGHVVEFRPVMEEYLAEFAGAGIGTAEDFRYRFVRNFYFGCEASDRFGFLAFADHVLPLGARLKCVLGTDLGHYNPTSMSQMLPEAHRAVDRGLMTEDDFRAMTFENPVELFATGNPDFFTGTVIEFEVEKVLQAES